MDAVSDKSYRQLSDIGTRLGTTAFPDYVLTAELHDEKTAGVLEDSEFADVGKRAYPVDSKASTWLSAAYLVDSCPGVTTSAADPVTNHIWQSIKSAAGLYGISADVDKVAKQLVDLHAETGKPAIEYVTADDGSRIYGIGCWRDVKTAAEFFDDNRRHYPLELRTKIAGFITKKAQEFGVDCLPDSVRREAGLGIPDKVDVMQELLIRAEMSKDAESGALLANINNIIANQEPEDYAGSVDKIAAALDAFDRSEGLCKHYGTKLTYPADFLYAGDMDKIAAEISHAVAIDNWVFDSRKLAASLDPDVLEAVCGPAVLADCKTDGKLDASKLKTAIDAMAYAEQADLKSAIVMLCED